MFEDSLVESTGRIRTRTKWFAIGSLIFQAALLAVLILLPYIYPASLPPQALNRILLAPAPPPAPVQMPAHAASMSRPVMMVAALTAPTVIPQRVAMNVHDESGPAVANFPGAIGSGGDMPGGLSTLIVPPPPPALRPKPPTRIGVSSGVMVGRLLTPIQPVYPVIARTAGISGTVVIAATISKQGTIENLRVLSGPPMLRDAAISAVAKARYKPYELNEQPVEVETTINVIFKMD